MAKHINVLLLLAFALLISMSLVEAKPYQQFTAIDIRHSVRINDAPTTSALCNITIINPVQDVMANFKPMTANANSQTYNFTLDGTNTTITGTYNYDITCIDIPTGFNKTDSFTFEVNHSGKEYTVAQSITYLFLFILSIFFFGLTLYGAIKIPYSEGRMQDDNTGDIHISSINYVKYFKLMCIVLCYCFLIMLSFLGWNIATGMLEFLTIGYIFQMIFWILLGFLLPLLFIIVIEVIRKLINDKRLREEIRERFTPQWQ